MKIGVKVKCFDIDTGEEVFKGYVIAKNKLSNKAYEEYTVLNIKKLETAKFRDYLVHCIGSGYSDISNNPLKIIDEITQDMRDSMYKKFMNYSKGETENGTI